ncbi:unnamed protein product [Owenia fusiformis]|uniref:Sulfotransferase domain-containing protein n=1 Tax=Owenia fusiformis TaxID=6347 RepID=A0A8S4NMC0_OWEFU|nr:unnamed protein product [Owenia fusiformis]
MKLWICTFKLLHKTKNLFLPLIMLFLIFWFTINAIMLDDKRMNGNKITLPKPLDNSLLSTIVIKSKVIPQRVPVNKTVITVDKDFNLSDLGNTRRIPKFLIIGVMNCGTNALFDLLNTHAQLVSPINEVNIFQAHDLGTEWFREQMPKSRHWQQTFDKSTEYFTINTDDVKTIKEINPYMRFLVIVCDPTKRAISHCLNLIEKGNRTVKPMKEILLNPEDEKLNIEDPIIDHGLYAKHLQTYYKVFPREKFHIIKQEELLSKPWIALEKVETFLKIIHLFLENRFYFNKEYGHYCLKEKIQCISINSSIREDFQQYIPNDDTVDELKQFYQPHNEEFATLVGMDFEWA